MTQHVRSHRRFTLRDILILILAIALGLWLLRAVVLNGPLVFGPDYALTWFGRVNVSLLVLMTTQLGVLVLSLMPPRPRLRRLARRPGFLAGIAVASVVACQTVQDLPSFRPGNAVWLNNYLLSIGGAGPMASVILLLWLVGSLRGLDWRRPEWVELLGRTLGVTWILAWIIFFVRRLS